MDIDFLLSGNPLIILERFLAARFWSRTDKGNTGNLQSVCRREKSHVKRIAIQRERTWETIMNQLQEQPLAPKQDPMQKYQQDQSTASEVAQSQMWENVKLAFGIRTM